MKRRTKYQILNGFNIQAKAQKFLDECMSSDKENAHLYSIVEKRWIGKDKTRHYVRKVTRPGSK